MIAFSAVAWLASYPLLLFLLWKLQRNSYSGGSRRRQWFWFGMRAALLLLVVLALSGLQIKSPLFQKQILFLVDLSDSMTPAQRNRAREWINRAIEKVQTPDQVGVIAFGANAQVERFPSTSYPVSKFETQVDATATNLESAVRLAEALFAANYQKNVVILSDGDVNSGETGQLQSRLNAKGISAHGVYLEPPNPVEASLTSVRLPEDLRLQQSFDLEVVTDANRSMLALLQIFLNGKLLQEAEVSLVEGKKSLFHFPQKLDKPGLYRYEVRLKPAADFRAENNTLESWTMVQGPPRILLVDEQPDDLKSLAAALGNRGFEVETRSKEYFPLTLQEMLLYQAIFIRNVSASAIHNQMPFIHQYVHDFGGGFAMIGGRRSFGPGGYYQTPVEKVLPVQMELVNKKYLADVAIVVVIDKSGSMSFADRGRQKIDLADEGGARLASLLKQSDHLGVLAVDSVPKWVYRLQKLQQQDKAIEAITSIRAGGGGIYVYSGLKEAYLALRDVKSTVKHVILFADTADCEEKEGPSGESSLSLAQKALDQNQITTTTIGIGQSGDPDVEFLQQLATIGDGRFYFTNDMFTLPEIFTQESSVVQRYYITEEPFNPVIVQREPLLTGVERVPGLEGYVATSPKPLASQGLVSHREDPVLAFWRYGLGQSVAFTSDAGIVWAKSWPQWPEYERFWSQTARYLARAPAPAGFRSSFHTADNRTTVIVETFEDVDATGIEFQGILLDRDGKEHRLQFSRVSPGRYEAPVDSSGTLFGKIFRLQDRQVAEESIVQFSSGINREYDIHSGGKGKLLSLTGKLVENPDQLRFPSGAVEDIQPLQHQLLLWAAILFLLDVALRKIDFTKLRLLPERTAIPEPVAISAPLQALKVKKTSLGSRTAPVIEVEMLNEKHQEEASPAQRLAATAEEKQSSDYLQRLKEVKKRRRD